MQTPTIMPIRLMPKEVALLNQLKTETGLSKSFILRRCISHSLPKFINNELDLLTLKINNPRRQQRGILE